MANDNSGYVGGQRGFEHLGLLWADQNKADRCILQLSDDEWIFSPTHCHRVAGAGRLRFDSVLSVDPKLAVRDAAVSKNDLDGLRERFAASRDVAEVLRGRNNVASGAVAYTGLTR